MKDLIDSIGALWKQFQNFLLGLLIVLLLAVNAVYQRLAVYWSNSEIILMVCVFFPTLGLVIWLMLSALARVGYDYRPSFGAGATKATGFDWVKAMNEVYNPARRKPALPIGVSRDGTFSEVAMRDTESHLMVVGGSGSGKSSLILQILLAANNGSIFQTAVYTIKPGDFTPVEDLKNVHVVKYDGRWDEYNDDMPRILGSIRDEIERRAARLSELGRANVWDMRSDQRPPLVLIVLEELGSIVNQLSPRLDGDPDRKSPRERFLSTLKFCLDVGRAQGIHLLLADQRPSGNIPRSITTACVPVAFRVKNGGEAFWATGTKDSGADSLKTLDRERGIPPEVVIVRPYANERTRVAWFTDDDIKMVVRLSDQENIKDFGPPTWLYNFPAPEPQVTVIDPPGPVVLETSKIGASTSAREAPDITTLPAVVAQWYSEVPYFRDQTQAYFLERGILVALGVMSGLEENKIMRGVWNGNTNGNYRAFVKMVREQLAEEGWIDVDETTE